MLDQLEKLQDLALSELEDVHDEEGLQRWKIAHLGRSSSLMKTFDQLGSVSKDEKIGRAHV